MGCGCGCPGTTPTGCGGAAPYVERDPVALKVHRMSGLGGMGDVLPTIVWPSDVEAYKRKIDPDMAATDGTARACAALPAPVLAAWSDFFKSWQSFRAESSPIFGSANKYEQARDFESKLAEWQSELQGAGCALNSPKVVPPASNNTTIVVVAVVAGLLAVAYLASPFVTAARARA